MTKTNPAGLYTVEFITSGPEGREEDSAAFSDRRGAEAFAYEITTRKNSQVWINGTKFTRQDFKETNL